MKCTDQLMHDALLECSPKGAATLTKWDHSEYWL